MAARRPPLLLGRAGEREALDRLLENVRGGQSAVLVIRGEAGVGKTALLHYCARAGVRLPGRADRRRRVRDGAAVRRAAPALRADARPARRAARAAAATRCASRSAWRPATPPDRFLVALAALSLLAEVAEERPLLCLVDDAQWLDGASAPGRSGSSRAGCWPSRWRSCSPCASRPTSASSPACRSCALGGLDDEDARALLATVIPGRLDERVRDRIVAETRGNPLALLELPRGLIADAAGRRVRAAGRRRRCRAGSRRASCGGSRRCPTRRAAAAAGRGGRAGRRPAAGVARGASGSASPARRSAPATRAGLLDDRRAGALPPSAGALGRLPLGVRRTSAAPCTGALAEATDADARAGPPRLAPRRRPRAGPTRRSRPSSSGRRAGRRPAAGSPRRRRSCGARPTLTPDPARRAERALAAAQASLQAGAFDAALALLAAARGRAAGRARARPRRPAARRGRLRPEPRQRRSAAAAPGRADARAARRPARARDLPRRLERRAVRRAAGAAPAACSTSRAPCATAPRAAAPAAPVRPAAGRLRAACSPTGAPPRRRVLQARRHRVRRAPRSRSRRCCAGAGWRRRRRSYVWDYDTCLAVATRGVRARPRLRRARGPRRRRQRARPGGRAGRRLRRAPRC